MLKKMASVKKNKKFIVQQNLRNLKKSKEENEV